MGKLNRAVNIAVLVFAIVSVIFAFKLFSKREQLVSGWNKMSESIAATAKELDNNSGTKVSAEVTGLDHHKYQELDAALPKQAKTIIAQRDTLATGVVNAVKEMEAKDQIDEAALKDVSKSAAEQEKAIGALKKINTRDNAIIKEIIACGEKVDAKLDQEQLKDVEGYTVPLNTFNTKVENVKKRMVDYGKNIADIASTLEINAPSLQVEEYASALGDTLNAVKNYKAAFEQTKKDLAAEKTRVKEMQVTIEEKVAKIGELEKSVSDKNTEIKKLNDIIYGPEGKAGEAKLVEEGDPDLLKELKGKVVDVNNKWDFVVIDLGAKSKIKKQVGKIVSDIDTPLPNNEEMLVSRGDNEFIGKIKIVKVYDNCAIANVINDTKKALVKTGDVVNFSDETIQKLKDASTKKAAAVEAALPAAAAPEKQE